MSTITKDPTGFTTSFSDYYNDDRDTEFFFHKIELADKMIINVQTNGIMDTTFELPISSRMAITHDAMISPEIGDAGIEPRLIVGNHSNLKIQIVATQIGKVIATSRNPKDTILSIGSRWFGRGDETNNEDFDRLMFILGNVKRLLG
ncbi:uncharacterized protein CANTADRAFT_90619 [Suhomyces tanzawaensis NRRL Y-17324]|uniref:Uncharacterized protein n=1 Tax=Suhomyces tanzawaensis NRRL Y-17324 TaxID=984487 RepID=A0A1E4SFK7_9ASCO|nr:uncharacterized protein CANTADRAFT_90619 [Suhomyces tanzawaensis NRRL Y-17324]ODV78250.1 hypothetical protein CANTADRAFT_90619 [Suhomyces tanzawaensis NRRL Y-17324]